MPESGKRTTWDLVIAVSVLFIQVYLAARVRAFSQAFPMVRLLAQSDNARSNAVLLDRELAIYRSYRSYRQNHPPKRRPYDSRAQRAEILQLMRLRAWSARETESRSAVHPDSIRNGRKAQQDKLRSERSVGSPPWNRLRDGVRWLVHEIRAVCPERDFGTRTIARHIMRAGVQISGASVRRIIEEDRPQRPARGDVVQSMRRTAPDHLFNPPRPNHVWHRDMTELRVLWLRFDVAAVIDGFSRRIMKLRVFRGTSITDELVRPVDEAARASTVPRNVVTDRGGQFQIAFRHALQERGIRHARRRRQMWQFNAKVERLFWSLNRWWRVSLVVPSADSIQKRLDAYATWYNLYRLHEALGRLIPSEAALGRSIPEPKKYTEGGEVEPVIRIKRRDVGGDPRLLCPVISARPRHVSAS